jgi:hypothetical protein
MASHLIYLQRRAPNSRILNLELSAQASPPTQAGYQHYYIRSWTFTYERLTEELTALCAHMAADDNRLPEVTERIRVGKLHHLHDSVWRRSCRNRQALRQILMSSS